jgi:hypothetical protein
MSTVLKLNLHSRTPYLNESHFILISLNPSTFNYSYLQLVTITMIILKQSVMNSPTNLKPIESITIITNSN